MKFKQLFSPNGRISRKSFIFIHINAYSLLVLLYCLLGYTAKIEIKALFYIALLILFIYCICMSIVLILSIIKRLHDLGHSGRDYWKLNIPLYGDFIVYRLFLEKGQIHDNEFGTTTWTKEEIDKIKPSSLKLKVNALSKRKYKRKDKK